MRHLLLLFLAATGLLACQPATSVMLPAPPAAPGALPYLALGDSYTIGEGAEPAERWPAQLAALSRAGGGRAGLADPDIIAQTGWTTAELQAAIAASGNERRDYGLVSLLIGVNNQYRGQDLATYRAELRELLATAIGFAGGERGRVVVLSIPDWGQTPFAHDRDRAQIGREINEFNAAARAESERVGVAFVEITGLTRAAGAGDFTADGLHYTGPHMAGWAARVLPVVRGVGG